MRIVQEDKSELEVETVDSFTGEGTGYFTISIINRMCNDSAHIDLSEDEALQLRDRLNDWIDD